jgi:P pilus assembly chaperone PapD
VRLRHILVVMVIVVIVVAVVVAAPAVAAVVVGKLSSVYIGQLQREKIAEFGNTNKFSHQSQTRIFTGV